MIEEIARSRGHEIVSIIDVDNREDFQSEAFRSADVAIEFTTPTAAYANYVEAFKAGVKVVSGSTGWHKDHEDDVKRLIDEGNTLFWASNFSLGVAIFSAVNKYLARIKENAGIDAFMQMVDTEIQQMEEPITYVIISPYYKEDLLLKLDYMHKKHPELHMVVPYYDIQDKTGWRGYMQGVEVKWNEI